MVFVALFGGYVLVSMIFQKFPTLIHKKKKLHFTAAHISHRGGAADNLENTIEAFRYAESYGTQMFELDCQLTKDGHVVVSHDNHLKRACDSELKISETNYEDLPLLKPRIKVDFYQCMEAQGEDRKIPLLETVFREFPNMPINIDIKTDDDELISKVNDLVVKYKREPISAWGNRADVVCQKLYKLNPEVPLFFSMRRVVHLVVLFWTGLLPFFPIKESLLEILIPGVFLQSDKIIDIHLTRGQRMFIRVMDILLMRPALINHLKRRGIDTYLWVLNQERDYDRAFKLGATGVMTDRVVLLKSYLDKTHRNWQTCQPGLYCVLSTFYRFVLKQFCYACPVKITFYSSTVTIKCSWDYFSFTCLVLSSVRAFSVKQFIRSLFM